MSTSDPYAGAVEVTPTAAPAGKKDTIIRLQRVHLQPGDDLIVSQDATLGVPEVQVLEVIPLGEQHRWTYLVKWVTP